MKRTIIALAAGALMSVGSFAYAAEALSDGQMDQVAAGTYYPTPYSWANTSGVVFVGGTASGASSSGSLTSSGLFTGASSATLAIGAVAGSTASAGSGFQ